MDGELRIDSEIAALAARQHGVVSRAQLDDLGIGRGAIEQRLGCDRLHAVHRGVYAVGHPGLTREGRWMAATLAVPGSVLSHQAAAACWRIHPDAGLVEVATVRKTKSRSGLTVHTVGLEAVDCTVRLGVPITTVTRTLFDLASVVRAASVRRAHREAEYLRLVDHDRMAVLLDAHPRRRGTPVLRLLIGDRARTRSPLEDRFRRFLRRYRIPKPEFNVKLPFGEADCAWPGARLNVELDGGDAHRTRDAFERDRARDRAAALLGWTVVRVTSEQLRDQPDELATDLRTLLAATEPQLTIT